MSNSNIKKYVLGFYYTQGGCFLIEKNTPEWQKGLVNGLGGSVESGESLSQAMAREFKEECGIETMPEDWEFVLTIAGRGFELYVFRAAGTPEVPPVFRHECDEGVVSIYREPPTNMETTALWLYYLCKDMTLPGAGISGTMPV